MCNCKKKDVRVTNVSIVEVTPEPITEEKPKVDGEDKKD